MKKGCFRLSLIFNLFRLNLNLYILMSFFTQRHSFHLVDLSIMPIVTSFAVLTMTVGGVMYFHGYSFGFSTLSFGLLCVLLCMFLW